MHPVVVHGLLLVGTFHGDEVDAVDGSVWWALTATELVPVQIRVETVRDEVLDYGAGLDSGRRVSAPSLVDPPQLLIRADGFSAGALEVAQPAAEWISLGEQSRFYDEEKSAWLTVSAFGEASRPGSDPFSTPTVNYGLVARRRDGARIELMSPAVLDDARPQVLWVGDLDRDGQADVIADVSPKYGAKKIAIYLSSLPGPAPSATFVTTGC